MVRHAHAKLGIVRQPLPKVLRVALQETAALRGITRDDWAGAIRVQVRCIGEQRVLGIMYDEPKTGGAIPIAQCEKVVRYSITWRDKRGDRRIKVARVNDH